MKKSFVIKGQDIKYFQWQKKLSQHLAAIAGNSLQIYDRKGEKVAHIQLQSDFQCFQWSWNGSTLAVLLKSGEILFCNPPASDISKVDTGMKGLEYISWSLDNEIIAAGSNRGALLIYHIKNSKKIPIQGKHSKAITGLNWNSNNQLACCSSDKTITINDKEGNTIHSVALKGQPSFLQWSQDSKPEKLAVALNGKSILVFSEINLSNPYEFALNSVFGSLSHLFWHQTGLIAGFHSGYLVSISTELNSIIYQAKIYKNSLSEVFISMSLKRCISCGDNEIKVQDLNNLNDTSLTFALDEGSSTPLEAHYSDDGQFLSVLSKDKSIHCYSAKTTNIATAWNSRVIYLKSLNDIAILNFATTPAEMKSFKSTEEPKNLGIGPSFAILIHDKKVIFHELSPFLKTKPDQLQYQYPKDNLKKQAMELTGKIYEKNYNGNVQSIETNEKYAKAFLENGRIELHPLEENYLNGSSESMIFPENAGTSTKISASILLFSFLFYATTDGKLHGFDLEGLTPILEFNYGKEIKSIIGQPGIGLKLILIDEHDAAVVFNPLNERMVNINGWNSSFIGALWETEPKPGRNMFIAWSDSVISTYSFHKHSLKGAQCIALHVNTKLPFGFRPILFKDNSVVCQSLGGSLENVPLYSHREYSGTEFVQLYPNDVDQARLMRVLYLVGQKQCLWSLFPYVPLKKTWVLLAEALLQILEFDGAKKIFKMIGDIAMVINIERISKCEDLNEVLGHVCVLFGDFTLAQQYFLNSANPKEAYIMRKDLLEWDQALLLAQKLAPEEMSFIYLEYGNQLEMDGKFGEAHSQYEQAIVTAKGLTGSPSDIYEHQIACQSGLIRMTFALGDIVNGTKLLSDINDKKLISDCISILENLKQFLESGILYERIGNWEKAAESYIKVKNWNRLRSVLPKVTNPNIYILFGKAKEAEGNYSEAANAYEKAKDYDNVIRILIDHLQDIEGAAALVRQTKARESAKSLASRFLKSRLFEPAIEFYLIAGMQPQAFEIAKQQNCVDFFASIVHDDASVDLLVEIADHFETNGNFIQAGRYLFYALKYPEALRMFLQCPSNDEVAIELAINTIGEANNDSLTHELIDFLMGERDGIPKDAKFIFKLYMSLGQFKEAARTAVIIAREEQVMGNYRVAHDLLFDNYMQLKKTGGTVPAELDRMLTLVHSYVIVKALVRAEEHLLGARMLIRVSNHISKFPAHVVPILTSTVIECYRSGLKSEAFEYASILMRPEHRQKLDEKFKRKIEQIVRRPEKSEVEEVKTSCTFCDAEIPESLLDCPECKGRLSYCIFSGKHMVLSDWSQCPSCQFPALYSQAKLLAEKFKACPMCNQDVFPHQFELINMTTDYLHSKKIVEEKIETNGFESNSGAPNIGGLTMSI